MKKTVKSLTKRNKDRLEKFDRDSEALAILDKKIKKVNIIGYSMIFIGILSTAFVHGYFLILLIMGLLLVFIYENMLIYFYNRKLENLSEYQEELIEDGLVIPPPE